MSAKPEASAKLSLENKLHIIVCLALFVVFVIFALRPAFERYGAERDRVARAKSQIAEHGALLPFQVELLSELSQTPDEALKAIDLMPLRKEDFAAIHKRLMGMSKAHGLNLQTVAPRVHSSPGSIVSWAFS